MNFKVGAKLFFNCAKAPAKSASFSSVKYTFSSAKFLSAPLAMYANKPTEIN